MNSLQRGALVLLLAAFFAHDGVAAGTKTYSAIVRLTGSDSKTVSVEAKDYQEAKERIRGMYCGGIDCIVEGPWERH